MARGLPILLVAFAELFAAPPTGAAVGGAAWSDAPGDSIVCEVDLTNGDAIVTDSSLHVMSKFVCPTDPRVDPRWSDGTYSFTFEFDVDGDSHPDFVVDFDNLLDTGHHCAYTYYGKPTPGPYSGYPISQRNPCSFDLLTDGSLRHGLTVPWSVFPPASQVRTRIRSKAVTSRNPDGGYSSSGDVSPEWLAWSGAVDVPRPVPGPAPAPTPQPSSGVRQGYWMVEGNGRVHAFGDAAWLGNLPGGISDAVDVEPTRSGNGYWVVTGRGDVFPFGDAPSHGGAPPLLRDEKVTSLSGTAGGGYWLFTTKGRVIPYGGAPFLGDMSDVRLNGPVLDSIPTPTSDGYYLVASDGGIFTFGTAAFAGSMGGLPLNQPVQSLVPDPDGGGYWLVASDGGIFAFDAAFHGSMGDVKLNRPVTGMVGFGAGYLMVAEDGGIFTFGDAPFKGSLGNSPPASPIAAAAVLNQR